MDTSERETTTLTDVEICSDVTDQDLSRHEFARIYAKDKIFTRVKFTQSRLSSCYFRKCEFRDCDFTGAAFKDCNLRGSQFKSCQFRYTTWDKTLLDETILDYCLPSEENLARDLVRALRVNFSQIGNHEGANKAAAIEVTLTGRHLYKAAYSRESYYRGKYTNWTRVRQAVAHARWKLLDLLWGNGESVARVLICGLITIALFAIVLWIQAPGRGWGAAASVVSLFWGVKSPDDVPLSFAILLAVMRYILFGLFMAVLIKRLSRR